MPGGSSFAAGTADGAELLSRWVDAARRGDSDAFGQLWMALSPRVCGYLRGRGVSSAEDLTSEVFLAAFAGLPSFVGEGAGFRSWLFTIAHHKAVDDLRRRRPTSEWTPETDPRAEISAEDSAFEGMLGERVRRMLGALTPDQREVLLLRAVGDLSVDEVATITGRTVGSVKQLFHRAMATAQRTDPGEFAESDLLPPPAPVVQMHPRRETQRPIPVTGRHGTTMTEL